MPPATDKSNRILDSTIVSTWSNEFNLDEVCNETEDQTILTGINSEKDFGSSAIIMTGKELPEVEMDDFVDNNDTQSDETPEAIPMDVEEKSTDLIVPQIKLKTVTFANPPQQIFSKLELDLNPQVNRNKKKESKKAKKASKKKRSNEN